MHTPNRKLQGLEWNKRPWHYTILFILFSGRQTTCCDMRETRKIFFLNTTGRPKTLNIYPTEPIVILMKRRDLIKTFQTLFAWRCSAEATACWAHLTPRRSKAGGLLFPLEGELTNQSNAFSGSPRSVPLRFNHYPQISSSFSPQRLSLKIHLAAVCMSSWRMSSSKAGCEGRGDYLHWPRGDFWTPPPPLPSCLWCMWVAKGTLSHGGSVSVARP